MVRKMKKFIILVGIWVLIASVFPIFQWVDSKIQPKIIEKEIIKEIEKPIEIEKIVYQDRIIEKPFIIYEPKQIEFFTITQCLPDEMVNIWGKESQRIKAYSIGIVGYKQLGFGVKNHKLYFILRDEDKI